jgi:hypothetical protein
MKLLWTQQARRDRRTIFDYIRPENPMAAVAMDDQFAMPQSNYPAIPIRDAPAA